MKITIDRTKCDGFAKCVQASPKVFKLDSKMIAEVIDPKADTDEKIVLAAKICPTKASIKNLVEARYGIVVVFDHPFRPRRVELQSLR